MESYWNKT